MASMYLLRIYLFTGCCLTVLLLISYYSLITYKHFTQTDINNTTSRKKEYVERFSDSSSSKSEHQILIYQPKEMNTRIRQGFQLFDMCAVNNCFLTTKESHITRADVLLFGENTAWEPPVPRPLNQIWVIRLLESPENTLSLKNYQIQINYTASYRLDADILAPYGVYKAFDPKPKPPKVKLKISAGKSGGVAWFVSHCLTNNDRMGYARRLSKYINVDTFGKCSKHMLSKEEGVQRLRSHYKFYLAFENSNCRHYITEKFWDTALKNNVIPIVMGPPREDYELVAPPRSFIHVDDFQNPEQLAKFLHRVENDEDLFNAFFDWKYSGSIVDSGFYCRLCAFVQHPKPKVYDDIDQWWRRPTDCQRSNISFTVHG